jgi:hypothetical protein
MKIKTYGILPTFYKWSYGKSDDDLTPNFCNYFWGLVLAALLLPITIWSLPFQRLSPLKENEDWAIYGRVGFTAAVTSCLLMIGMGFSLAINSPGAFFGTILGFTIFGFGLYAAMTWKFKDFGREIVETVSERTTSFKQNYCPKIDWSSTNDE